jgi:hypothetical protein
MSFTSLPPSFVPGNGQISNFDVWIAPFVRDVHIIVPGVAFFFAVQFLTKIIASRALPRFRALNEKDQLDWCVRAVAVVNGVICQRSTYLWLTYLWNIPEDFQYDMYTPLPGYREPLAMLLAYFLWDFIVCIVYGWSWAYTIHAVASGIGMYLCSFPCSDLWSPYYAGVYELSNMSFHGAQMIRMVTDQSLGGWRTTLPVLGDAFFVFWFFAIRLAGGLYTSSKWLYLMGNSIADGTVHNYSAALVMMPLFMAVIGVQFLWAGEVFNGVKIAMGIGAKKKSSAPPANTDSRVGDAPVQPAKPGSGAKSRKTA